MEFSELIAATENAAAELAKAETEVSTLQDRIQGLREEHRTLSGKASVFRDKAKRAAVGFAVGDYTREQYEHIQSEAGEAARKLGDVETLLEATRGVRSDKERALNDARGVLERAEKTLWSGIADAKIRRLQEANQNLLREIVAAWRMAGRKADPMEPHHFAAVVLGPLPEDGLQDALDALRVEFVAGGKRRRGIFRGKEV